MYSQNGNSSSGSQSPQPVESSHHPSRTIKRGSWAQSDEEDSEEEESKPTFSKRKNSKASTSSNSAVNDMSSFDKDQRKLARMIRNRSKFYFIHSYIYIYIFMIILSRFRLLFRNLLTSCHCYNFILYLDAAQASRDRKKEYTQTLELRVAELESQLLPSSNNNNSSTNNNSNSQQINNNPPTQPTRQRQQKRSRSSSNTSESLPLFNLNGSLLEEQNETLRSQLYSEQMESARLRLKLESLEFKFNKMEELIPNNPVILPLHFSSFPSTTELAFQPIFSFASSTSLLEEEELDIKPIISYEDEPSSPSASSHSSMESESIIKTLLPEQASLRILTRETTMQRKQTWKVKPSSTSFLTPLSPPSILPLLHQKNSLSSIIMMITFHLLLPYLVHLPIQTTLISVPIVLLSLLSILTTVPSKELKITLEQSSLNGSLDSTLMTTMFESRKKKKMSLWNSSILIY